MLPREYSTFRFAVAGILSTGEGAEREIAFWAAVLALSKVKCHVKCLKFSVRVLFFSYSCGLRLAYYLLYKYCTWKLYKITGL
jgi:hypothetical protein